MHLAYGTSFVRSRGGGGADGLLPKYFLKRLVENQVVLPAYDLFLPENGHLKNPIGGLQQPLPPPRTPMQLGMTWM